MGTIPIPDPIAERLKRAVARSERAKAARVGEPLPTINLEEMARQAAPEEFEKFKKILRQRMQTINEQKPAVIPPFRYEEGGTRLEVGKYALALKFRELAGQKEVILRVGRGDILWQHVDEMTHVDEMPEVPISSWVFRAAADESGFYWMNPETGARFTPNQMIETALEALCGLLESDL